MQKIDFWNFEISDSKSNELGNFIKIERLIDIKLISIHSVQSVFVFRGEKKTCRKLSHDTVRYGPEGVTFILEEEMSDVFDIRNIRIFGP